MTAVKSFAYVYSLNIISSCGTKNYAARRVAQSLREDGSTPSKQSLQFIHCILDLVDPVLDSLNLIGVAKMKIMKFVYGGKRHHRQLVVGHAVIPVTVDRDQTGIRLRKGLRSDAYVLPTRCVTFPGELDLAYFLQFVEVHI